MKKGILYFSTIIFAVILVACSESTSPSTDAVVKLYSEMNNPIVNKFFTLKNDNSIQANEVDSMKITSVRMLMSEVKLHPENDDANKIKVIKTGPFVYSVTNTDTSKEISSTNIPEGYYKKIKFEFHRFSSSEISQYANNSLFKDFATNDRYTTIIEGVVYKYGNPANFIFNSDATANLELNFAEILKLTANNTTKLALQINPNLFFKKSGSILDPRDSKNRNDIENLIKSQIKIYKKSI